MLSFTKPLPIWAQAMRRCNAVAASAAAGGGRRAATLRHVSSTSRSAQQHTRSTLEASNASTRLQPWNMRRAIPPELASRLLSALSTSSEPATAYLDLREQAPQLLPQVPHDLIGRYFEFAARYTLPSFLKILVQDLSMTPRPGVPSLGAPPGHQRRKVALRGLIRGASSTPVKQQQQPEQEQDEEDEGSAGTLLEQSKATPNSNLRLLQSLPHDLLAHTFAVLLEPEASMTATYGNLARQLPLPDELSFAQARSLARELAATRDAKLAPLMGALLEHLARPMNATSYQESIEHRWPRRDFPHVGEGARLIHYYLSLPSHTRTGVYEMLVRPDSAELKQEEKDRQYRQEQLSPHQVALRLANAVALDRDTSVGLALAKATLDGESMRKALVASYELAVELDASFKLQEAELRQRLDSAVFETTLLSLCARLFAQPPRPQFNDAATALLDIDALQSPQDVVPRFVTVQARELVLRAMLNNKHRLAVSLCAKLARLLVSTQPKASGEAVEQYDYVPGEAVLLESRWLEDLFDQYAATAPDVVPGLLTPLVEHGAPGALAVHLGSPKRIIEALELMEQMNRPARRVEVQEQTYKLGVALGFWQSSSTSSSSKAKGKGEVKGKEEMHRRLDARFDEAQRARIVAWAARGECKAGAGELYRRWAGEGPVCESWKAAASGAESGADKPPLQYEAPGVVQSSAVMSALVKLFSMDATLIRRRDEKRAARAVARGEASPSVEESTRDEEASHTHAASTPLDLYQSQHVTSAQRAQAKEDFAFARYVVSRFRGAHSMADHSHHNLTALAGACFRLSEASEAFLSFSQLLLRRVVPDSYDITTLLNGMAEHDLPRTIGVFLRHIKTGPSWLSKNSKAGIEPTEAQYTVLLAHCIRQNRLELGQQLVRSAEEHALADTLAIRAPALLLRVLAEEQKDVAPRMSGVLSAVKKLLRLGWQPESSLLAWLAHRAATRPSKERPASERNGVSTEAASTVSFEGVPQRRAVAGDEALSATRLLMLSVSTVASPRLDLRATKDVIQALHNQAAYICFQTRLAPGETGGKWPPARRDKKLRVTLTAIDRVVRMLRWTEELQHDEEVTRRTLDRPNVLPYNTYRSLVYLYLVARDATGALEVLAYMREVGLDVQPSVALQERFYRHFAESLDALAQGEERKRSEWRARLRGEEEGARSKEWWKLDAPAGDMPVEMEEALEWENE